MDDFWDFFPIFIVLLIALVVIVMMIFWPSDDPGIEDIETKRDAVEYCLNETETDELFDSCMEVVWEDMGA